ncbi:MULTISPECIES: META domain-containing protein [unclassified Arsukibacterium]|uniref:META domain-containing protein n=1 Tax=unclassified Arsukibacterium TaxID=2635278 RepID=UPI000C8CFBDA|nr:MULTISPECIES: META domain-containing protein [unclassified Arsukibacterium]MAA95030.1 heat-shock protein [Rheinheimera sp.]HAW91995.1 heat-shock protein [Candidatus Azambacteria bacterium]
MKKSLLLAAMVLAGCSQLPAPEQVSPEQVSATPAAPAAPEQPQEEVVPDSETTKSIATNFEQIFIDNNVSFSGTLPCADCPGIQYHLNLYRDGRFEVRQEYLERGEINIIKGIWLLEKRNLHLVNQQHTLPAFYFSNNNQLAMLDLAGKPISSALNYQLKRIADFSKLDTRQPMLGLYFLNDNNATFTLCQTGESLPVANTQHHLPMMRHYQRDERLQNNAVIATLVGRKQDNAEGETQLLIEKFEQFWPNAVCPDPYAPGQIQGIVWRAEKLAGRYVPQQLNVRMLFDSQDRLYGFAGCNSFNGSYKQQSNRLNVAGLASTQKFCSDSSQFEQQFTSSLQAADRAEVNGNKLQLFKDNSLLIELKPALN